MPLIMVFQGYMIDLISLQVFDNIETMIKEYLLTFSMINDTREAEQNCLWKL